MKDGKKVFRYTEVGLDWNGGNAIGVQHIYPGSQIGLGSDATLLATAQNMITEMARWNDDNGTNTFYPAAARVGHDPNDILRKTLRIYKNGADAGAQTGTEITISTAKGDVLVVATDGTAYSDVVSKWAM